MTNVPDSGQYDYSVVFYLEGLDRPFEYQVSKETSERVRESLEEESLGNLVFEAFQPAEQIVVNSRFIQLAQFCWRPVSDAVLGLGSGPDERANEVVFHFPGRQTPIVLVVDDPEEVFDLILAMETEAFPLCSIVDAKGEEAVLDLRRLACAEFPLGLADRGGAQALFELEEEV